MPEGTLEEGETVTLVVDDEEAGFSLTEDEQAFLAESLAQIRRGEWVDGWQVLSELKA